MGNAWRTFWSVITHLLTATDNVAISLDNISQVAVHTSAQYRTEALQSLQEAEAKLAAPVPTP
jgi:hypothetical protein